MAESEESISNSREPVTLDFLFASAGERNFKSKLYTAVGSVLFSIGLVSTVMDAAEVTHGRKDDVADFEIYFDAATLAGGIGSILQGRHAGQQANTLDTEFLAREREFQARPIDMPEDDTSGK